MSFIRTCYRISSKLLPRTAKVTNNILNRSFCTVLVNKQVPCASNNTVNYFYLPSRSYAKGKDKKKEKGKKKIEINETQLNEVLNVETLKAQMQKSVDLLKLEFVKHLSLRSTTGSIESMQVTLDGQDYVLQELAQITRKNPTTVVLNMATFPQAIPATLKSLEKSGMNLNPQQDGTTIYIPVPKVTVEHRENLAKNAKVLFIKCRDNIKDTQNKFSKNVKKQNSLAEDLVHSVQDQIVTIADQYIAEAEKLLIKKQSELLGKN